MAMPHFNSIVWDGEYLGEAHAMLPRTTEACVSSGFGWRGYGICDGKKYICGDFVVVQCCPNHFSSGITGS